MFLPLLYDQNCLSGCCVSVNVDGQNDQVLFGVQYLQIGLKTQKPEKTSFGAGYALRNLYPEYQATAHKT